MEVVSDVSNETGACNFFGAFHHGLLFKGPHWSNFQVWVDRFKNEFDPDRLSNPPAPYDPEEIIESLPHGMLTKVRSYIRRAKRG